MVSTFHFAPKKRLFINIIQLKFVENFIINTETHSKLNECKENDGFFSTINYGLVNFTQPFIVFQYFVGWSRLFKFHSLQAFFIFGFFLCGAFCIYWKTRNPYWDGFRIYSNLKLAGNSLLFHMGRTKEKQAQCVERSGANRRGLRWLEAEDEENQEKTDSPPYLYEY